MNDKNLIPNSERTPSERRELARKAGIASGKKRRDKRNFRETYLELLSLPMADKSGKQTVSPITGKPMSIRETMITSTLQLALKGDIKAFQTILDVLGERNIALKSEVTAAVKVEKADTRTPEEIMASIERLQSLTDLIKKDMAKHGEEH